MSSAMVIEATNESGTIRIEAGEGTWRTYSWNGKKETVQLVRRPSRWYGSLGLYHPGGGKRVHLVVDEGQQHFCSTNEAMEWLLWEGDRMHWVYTSDGLVVGWYKTQKPNTDYWAVIVEVWQFYIKGRKPIALQGAANDRIRVTKPESPTGQEPEVGKFAPSEPKTINGRLYSGKALDYMRDMDFSPKNVENAIVKGKLLDVKPAKEGWKSYWLYNRREMMLVVLDAEGRVVCVQ